MRAVGPAAPMMREVRHLRYRRRGHDLEGVRVVDLGHLGDVVIVKILLQQELTHVVLQVGLELSGRNGTGAWIPCLPA
jgi:hypothetical protein